MIIGDDDMKKILILLILGLTIISCTTEDMELIREARREREERGYRCRYNYKGELQHCGYIN